MYACLVIFADTMGPWLRRDEIVAFCDILHDELTESEASSSVKKLNVHSYEGIEPRHTKAVSMQIVPA